MHSPAHGSICALTDPFMHTHANGSACAHVDPSMHTWIHPCTQICPCTPMQMDPSLHAGIRPCAPTRTDPFTHLCACCLPGTSSKKAATGARISCCRNTLEPLTILLSLTRPFLPCLHTLTPQIPPMLLLPAPTSPAAQHSEGTLVLNRLNPVHGRDILAVVGCRRPGFGEELDTCCEGKVVKLTQDFLQENVWCGPGARHRFAAGLCVGISDALGCVLARV